MPKRSRANQASPHKRTQIYRPITNYQLPGPSRGSGGISEFLGICKSQRVAVSASRIRRVSQPGRGHSREREREGGGVELKGRRCREWWWLKSARAMVPIESYQFPRAFPKQVSSRAPPRAQRRRRKEERTSGIHAPRAHEGERE